MVKQWYTLLGSARLSSAPLGAASVCGGRSGGAAGRMANIGGRRLLL